MILFGFLIIFDQPYGLEVLATTGATLKVRVAWFTAQALFAATQVRGPYLCIPYYTYHFA